MFAILWRKIVIFQDNEIGEKVIYWPPLQSKDEKERARSVPPSLKTKSITDPDRIDEYRRQKELELEALRRREEEIMLCRQKQVGFCDIIVIFNSFLFHSLYDLVVRNF